MTTCRTSQSAISQAENGRSKRSWNSTEESLIRSRAKQELQRLELAKKISGNEIEAQNLADMQRTERATSEYQSVHVDLVNLYPDEFSKQENYLARVLGIHRKKLGVGEDLTQAGQVKLQIADTMTSARNLIDVTARYAFKKHSTEAIRNVHSLLAQRNVPKNVADEFINNVIEVAKSPRQRVSFGNTPGVNMILAKRHNVMMDEARKLGLSDEDMNTIVSQLTRALTPLDDTHAVARVLGAQMGTVENVGYVPRMFTELADKYFKLKKIDPQEWLTYTPGMSAVQKSRGSYLLVPEDYEVLAELLLPGRSNTWNDKVKELTKGKGTADEIAKLKAQIAEYSENAKTARTPKLADGWNALIREKSVKEGPDYLSILKEVDNDEMQAMYKIAEMTGMNPADLYKLRYEGLEDSVAELHRLADDGVALTHKLYKDLTATQLDDLVDAGILHKLEMTTREVADYMARQYELPYQKVSGMFEYDLQARINRYTDQLRTSAGEANLLQNLASEGIDKGWAIPAALMGPEHNGFVKLSGVDITRFALDPKIAEKWEGLYVHPTVANQLKAYLELSTNPGKLSQFANVWSYVLRNFNVTTLLGQGVKFLSRNVIGGTINYLAGGGNLARVIPGIHEYARVVGPKGLEVLDDTRKFIKWPGTAELITKREAFKRMFIKRGTDWISAETGNRIGVNTATGTAVSKIIKYVGESLPLISLPRAMAQQVEYARYIGKGWNTGEGVKLAGQQFNDYIQTVFAPIAYGNAVVDGGLKWAWFMSKVESSDGALGKMDDFATWVTGSKRFTSAEDLFNEMDNYFVNPLTMGTAQKTLSKYVIPFGTFAMASTPMAVRHAIRNPAQFMAYSRGMRMLHRDHMNDPDMREAGFSEFELDGIPMTLMKDPKNPNQVLTLFTTNVDMYGGTFAYLARQASRVDRLATGMVGRGDKDREALRDPYGLLNFIQDQFKDNQNPILGLAGELYSGKDSLGRDIETLKNPEVFGAKVDPTVAWLVSKVPFVSTLSKELGGRGAITSSSGVIESAPAPGLLGTPNREATRSEEAKYRARQFMGDALYETIVGTLGLNVRTIDLEEGRQHTLNDVRFTIKTLQKKLREPNLSDEQRAVITNQVINLQVDEHRVSQWLQQNNVPDPKALRALRDQGINVRDLPMDPNFANNLLKSYTGATLEQR